MNVNMQYVTIIVKDIEESVAFYRDTLRCQEGYSVDLPSGGKIVIMQTDAASAVLIEDSLFPVGVYSMGADVDDLDAQLAYLAKKGVEPISPIVPTSMGRQVFIEDPNGIRLCLYEHPEDYRREWM